MKFPTNKYTGMPILHKKSILQMKINITDYVLVSVWGIPIPWYGMLETKVNFAEIFSKTVSIWISSILRVPWCFICQMNSPYVRIKWLKGYWILSTNTEMRASESWDSNRGTPCRSRKSPSRRHMYIVPEDMKWLHECRVVRVRKWEKKCHWVSIKDVRNVDSILYAKCGHGWGSKKH